MSGADAAALLFPAVVAFVLTPGVIAASRRVKALDHPGPEKLHLAPVPTLGGLGVLAAVLGTLWGLEAFGLGLSSHHVLSLTLATLPVVAVGLRDDLAGASIRLKLTGHLMAGGILYAFGVRVVEITNPLGDTFPLGALSLPVTMLWVALITNALNLLDGLDGLAAGAGAIAGFFLAMAGVLEGEADVRTLGLVLAGAVLGFYPYNFPRARVFLGDVGSTFIGLVLATLALLQNRKTTVAMTLLLPIVALGLPVLDTLFAVVRRTASRRNPLQRDLGHLHHRLLRLGLSTRQAVLSLLAVSAVFGSVALLLTALPKQVALSVTVILGGTSSAALAGLVRLERRLVRSERAVSGVPQERVLQKSETVLRT